MSLPAPFRSCRAPACAGRRCRLSKQGRGQFDLVPGTAETLRIIAAILDTTSLKLNPVETDGRAGPIGSPAGGTGSGVFTVRSGDPQLDQPGRTERMSGV